MMWIFLLAVGAAATFTVLGMFSVWIKVLSAALTMTLTALGVVLLLLVLKRVFRK